MLFDECDLPLIAERRLVMSRDGYVFSRLKNQKGQTFIHRVITGAKQGEVVDHINHNKTDNRRENLRVCTRAENNRNKVPCKKCVSKFLGVHYIAKWRKYSVMVKGKFIGYYKDEEDAARAYDKAAREIYGEFANPNFKD